MDFRLGLVFLLVLGGNWACNARNLIMSDTSGSEKVGKGVDICSLCEEYASLVVDYLSENKTQAEIIKTLHLACAEMRSFEDQCITSVDYYANLIFAEISLVSPDEFCQKVNLCQLTRILSLLTKQDSCDVCHQAVDNILLKLKDPDTKLDVIEILLKGCDAVENYVKKCKALVFEYGPTILVNAEKYLEETDICTAFHACSVPSVADADESKPDAKIKMVTSSSP